MGRKTLDELKLEVDGSLSFDPVKARKREEPQPELRKWQATVEKSGTIYSEVVTHAATEEEARKQIEAGDYDVIHTEAEPDWRGAGEIYSLQDTGPADA